LISITDHGVGISKDELKKIFDKFYRVPLTMVKKTRGSGLGLTLARYIIEAHGGTIEVQSEVGKGSTFTIKMPLLLSLTLFEQHLVCLFDQLYSTSLPS